MRLATLTVLSLSKRTSMTQDDEAMSVFTHSGPIAARYEGLQPTRSCPLWYATNDQKQPSRQTRDHLLLIRWS